MLRWQGNEVIFKMKRMYTTPVFFEGNGTITLTASQAAALGIGDIAAWNQFWEEAGEYCV